MSHIDQTFPFNYYALTDSDLIRMLVAEAQEQGLPLLILPNLIGISPRILRKWRAAVAKTGGNIGLDGAYRSGILRALLKMSNAYPVDVEGGEEYVKAKIQADKLLRAICWEVKQ